MKIEIEKFKDRSRVNADNEDYSKFIVVNNSSSSTEILIDRLESLNYITLNYKYFHRNVDIRITWSSFFLLEHDLRQLLIIHVYRSIEQLI